MVCKKKKMSLRDEIVHGTFITEGAMVAFPLCFPGASAPIVADESHITALDVTGEGIVYGGTSGWQTHLFVGMFHGVTGAVFDMGSVEGADQCVAMCCGNGKFVACVNGSGGGRFIRRRFQGLPFDLLQEWGFRREPFDDLGEAVKDEKIIHAVTNLSKEKVIASTEGHLVSLEIESGEIELIGEIAGSGRSAVGSKGNIFGLDERDSLWCYNPEEGKLTRNAIELPEGSWWKCRHIGTTLHWAKDPVDGRLYTADGDGYLFSFTEEEGFSPCLGQTPFAPVGSMAVTFDGRVFGTCGEGISNLFCYNPNIRELNGIGVAASVFERRRYGYTFGDAVTGRDGQIIFGEDDDRGHLWLYFPKIQKRTNIPVPWSEGEKIPWNDPAFSERMLKEHLSQNHNAASRRSEIIEKHVNWIHQELLSGNPTQILDLGCGPGLYTSRLSRLGHECVGIDFSPASISYAIDHAREENLRCKYIHQDIRNADYGTGYGLVMFIFGEFNVFRRADAKLILDKANCALAENGFLLLEPHSFSIVKEIGQQPPSWYSTSSGLFSDKPHLCLEENFWDSVNKIATNRYFIIDASTGDVTRHAASYQAYTNEQYRSLLTECGFEDVEFYQSLGGAKGESQNDLIAIVARKQSSASWCK